MPETIGELILWRAEHSMMSLEDLATVTGIHPSVIQAFVSCGLIEAEASATTYPLFAPPVVERLRSIVRLRRDLAVNLPAVAVILKMKENIEQLRKELEAARSHSLLL